MKLRATDLCKSFGRQNVLREVNLDLEQVHTLALQAYDKMMSGEARFRMVLTTGQ